MKPNTPYPVSHRDIDGFTLIELVVALAVTAMLSTLVFQSLDLGRRALTKSSGTNSRIEETLTLHRALRSKLQQIIPLQTKSSGVFTFVYLMGAEGDLQVSAREGLA